VLGVSPDSIRAVFASLRQSRGGARQVTASSTAPGADTSARGARQFGGDSSGRRRFGGAASSTASSTGRGPGRQGGGPGGAAGAPAAGGFGGGSGGPMVVFVKKGDKYTPQPVRVGISDFDYTEILSGVTQGEQVALLGAAVLQAQREQLQSRVRAGAGGGLQQQTTPAPGAGGAGGGGGGGRGGGRGGG
jgi:HlyD family secretion protein